MKKKHVLLVGGTSLDTIIHLPSPMEPGPQTIWAKESYQGVGCTGAGKALNLSRLGIDTTLHTIVGQDSQADFVLGELQHPNIELLVERTQAPTEQHTNLMSPSGERISIFTHPPDCPKEIDVESISKAMAKTDIAAISILDYTRPTLAIAKAHNKPLWIDLHDYDGKDSYHREFIDMADVIFVSSDNLPDYESFMAQQINAGKELVVCTHGKEGSAALTSEGRWYQQDILPDFPLVDSNGAGDAYFSGFLFAHFQNASLQNCMLYGSAAAALCVGSRKLYNPSLSPETLDGLFQDFSRR